MLILYEISYHSGYNFFDGPAYSSSRTHMHLYYCVQLITLILTLLPCFCKVYIQICTIHNSNCVKQSNVRYMEYKINTVLHICSFCSSLFEELKGEVKPLCFLCIQYFLVKCSGQLPTTNFILFTIYSLGGSISTLPTAVWLLLPHSFSYNVPGDKWKFFPCGMS